MNDAHEIIRKQLAILPNDVKEAILSSQMDENLAKIAKEHNLHIDQAAHLEEATGFLLLGLMDTQEFLSALTVSAKVSPDEATAIAQSVDRYILSPIRGSMQEIQRKLAEADEAENAKTRPEPVVEMKPVETAAGNIIETPVVDPSSIVSVTPIPTPAPTPTIHQAQSSGPIPNLRTMPRDIAHIKMNESIRMPKEEIAVRYQGDTGDKKGGKYGADPYREMPQ